MKQLPFCPAALLSGGDKSGLDSGKDPFMRRMTHGPTPLTSITDQEIN